VVLEAMANGVPVVTSRIQPFTDYLDEDDVIWCDPHDAASIAAGIAAGMQPWRQALLADRGLACAAAHGWAEVAARHATVYQTMMEHADA
jgi:glycosyltransferase involved in cell wall biosynthesis